MPVKVSMGLGFGQAVGYTICFTTMRSIVWPDVIKEIEVTESQDKVCLKALCEKNLGTFSQIFFLL